MVTPRQTARRLIDEAARADGADLPARLWALARRHEHGLAFVEAMRVLRVEAAALLSAVEALKASGRSLVVVRAGRTPVALFADPRGESVADGRKFRRTSDETGLHRFGVISDTHVGSKYARPDVVETMFDRFEAAGITEVYHCGNWIDGEARFNKFDLVPEAHGMQAQLDLFVAQWPRRKGIVTRYVTGDDHEGWYAQREGVNPGELLEQTAQRAGRHDLEHLGYKEAFVSLVHARSGKSSKLLVDHPGGGCFDGRAEILTRTRGWVPFSALTLDDSVATMTKAGHEFQWQHPTHVTDEPYAGPMYTFRHRCLDFTVTPTHRLWVANQRSRKRAERPKAMPQKGHGRKPLDWHARTAADIAAGFQRQGVAVPRRCSSWVGTLTPFIEVPRREPAMPGNSRNVAQMQHVGIQPIERIAELIGWFVTEGSAHRKGVAIAQQRSANPENHARIVALVASIGLRAYVCPRSVHIGSTELSAWLVSQCGNGSRHKFLPEWLKEQPPRILRILFDTMIAGDGWKAGESLGYRSISARLVSDMSEVAQKLGYAVTFSPNGESLTLSRTQVEPTINIRPTLAQYAGRIYCCTVPNELIYVRSGGRAFWSHNSAYADSYAAQKRIEAAQGGEKPGMWLFGHWHKLGYFMPRGVHVLLAGCTKDLDPFGRKKGLRYDVGGTIIEAWQDPQGGLGRVRADISYFFDRSYYNFQFDPARPLRKRRAPHGTRGR